MCLEGGCGACIVSVSGVHPVTKEKTTWSVNSVSYPPVFPHFSINKVFVSIVPLSRVFLSRS